MTIGAVVGAEMDVAKATSRMRSEDRIDMENRMQDKINGDRRRFLGTAAMTLAAVPLAAIDAAAASIDPKAAASVARVL